MYLSNPEVSKQFGEYALWWEDHEHVLKNDPLFMPCGRLHAGPSYFHIDAKWNSIQPVDQGQVALFKDVCIRREYVVQQPLSADAVTWALNTGPEYDYSLPHFRSKTFTVPDTFYQGMTWYLVYGAGSVTLEDADATDVTAYDIQYGLQDYDSFGINGSYPDLTVYYGWTVLLVKKTIIASSVVDSLAMHISCFGAWALDVDHTTPQDSIFTPEITTKWNIYHNPLNFPPHHLNLTPWQP
jgi:hypothetical protein